MDRGIQQLILLLLSGNEPRTGVRSKMSCCVLLSLVLYHSVGVKWVVYSCPWFTEWHRTKDRSTQLILLLLRGIEPRTGVHNKSFYFYWVVYTTHFTPTEWHRTKGRSTQQLILFPLSGVRSKMSCCVLLSLVLFHSVGVKWVVYSCRWF
jgi:hypothetical protein